jgi:AAA ATPase domain/Adenylate and Guanylate cyclase catalytic domain
MIQTLRGYGYRFMTAVEVCPTGLPDDAAGTKPDLDAVSATLPHTPPTLVGERKPVTILCCSLITPITQREHLGLDALHRLMRELYELARSAMHRYGGTIQHVVGDRLMVLFGVPVAREDHARRAVLAALGLQQRLSTRRDALRWPSGEHVGVRIGLHTGPVAVGGMDETREMATLHALLAQVEDTRGQVVGIAGEPGIGKSRLVHEFRRSLDGRGLTYLEGRCLSYGSSTPYLPVLDIIRQNCGITDADGPEAMRAKVRWSLEEVRMAPDEWEPYLLQLLGTPEALDRLATLSPQAIKTRTFATLTQMCMSSSRRRPLLLEIEDLHWIDPTSEEYLMSLVEQLAGAPILLLMTYRPGYRPAWMAKSYATQIALQRLTSDDSLQVV